jgi:dolichyl-diphosphooligosaccharide--protein glycosyltransferase
MRTVLEVQALTPQIAWYNFTTSFFIAFVSFIMLVYTAVKERSSDKTLFLVWSVVMLIAILGQRRFGYYYAVNAALLAGFFCWKMLDLVGLRRLLAKSREVVGAVKKFKKREKVKKKSFMQPRDAWVRVILVGIALFFFVFFPNIPIMSATAGSPIIMDEGWYTSLLWLRDNSPEPFGGPDFYYELYPPKDEFEYPETAYGVMSWWDYGYFIMQLAHRIPNANPGQAGAVQAGQFLLAQDEESAQEIVDRDNLRTRYVAIDYQTPLGKFHALPEWAGGNVSEFYEAYYYYRAQASQFMPVPLAYPAYYYCMVSRLYYFDAEEQPGSNTLVVSYDEEAAGDGTRYKLITSAKIFSSYTDAVSYIMSQPTTDYSIMGVFPSGNVVVKYEEKVSEGGIHYQEITDLVFFAEPYYTYDYVQQFISSQQTGNYKVLDPFVSPVHLEELENYQLVHSSESLYTFTTLKKQLPSVKIFEYVGPNES